MPNGRSKVSVKGNVLTLELGGKADPKVVSGCIQALLDCAQKNGCLDGRLSISDACLRTAAAHNEKTRCITSCFGCA